MTLEEAVRWCGAHFADVQFNAYYDLASKHNHVEVAVIVGRLIAEDERREVSRVLKAAANQKVMRKSEDEERIDHDA